MAAEIGGSNAGQVVRAIRSFADSLLPRETFRGLDTWARQASTALRRQCPSKEAKQTISGRAVQTAGGAVAHVQCVSEIGSYLEYGTGLYGPEHKMIRAKGGSYEAATGGMRTRAMLRWKTDKTSYRDKNGKLRKIRGGYMFATEVRGMKPRPWFWPTLETMLGMVREHIANAIQRAVVRAFVGVPGARLLSPSLPAIPALPPVRGKG